MAVSSLSARAGRGRRSRPPATAGALRPRLARAAGALSLCGLVVMSFMVVVIAAQHPSFLAPTTRPGFFPGWLAGPLGGLWPGLTIDPATLEWLVSALIAAMYAFYVVAFIVGARLRARWTVGTLLSLHVIFFLAPPLSYTDVFNYINYGRIGVLHHLNPYTALPVLAPHADPSFALRARVSFR